MPGSPSPATRTCTRCCCRGPTSWCSRSAEWTTCPTILPAHLREGIRLLRPKPLRAGATAVFRRALPVGSTLLGGRWRTLPQSLTDHYLSRCVAGIRYFHPRIEVLGVVPPPHDAPGYGRVRAGHRRAVRAALDWGRRTEVELLRLDEWVQPFLGTPGMNVDGIHWGWDCHRAVGERAAGQLRALLAGSCR